MKLIKLTTDKAVIYLTPAEYELALKRAKAFKRAEYHKARAEKKWREREDKESKARREIMGL